MASGHRRAPLVLGINAAYHQSSAAICRGTELLFAVEEERFSRIKHAKPARVDNPDELPWKAIEACCAAGSTTLAELDGIGYSLLPGRRSATVGLDPYGLPLGAFGTVEGEDRFDAAVCALPRLLAERAGDPAVAERVHFVAHHRAHGREVFFGSGWQKCAVLVVDGIGESATAWLGVGEGDALRQLEEVPYPHSLGLLWERIACYCGFGEYGAPKVMGLAGYGDPERFAAPMAELLQVPGAAADGPPFRVDAVRARLRAGDVVGLEKLFGPRRELDLADPLDASRFADLAAALQLRTEEALLATAQRLAQRSGSTSMAYSGGVALNCVANARLEREGPFDALYISAAAHDAGTAVGAALEVALSLGAHREAAHCAARRPFCGPSYDASAQRAALVAEGLAGEALSFGLLVERVVELLQQGKLVGWFDGALELGPRALGHRSLLADPRDPQLRERLNARIKYRESFRPFAASLLVEELHHWFEIPERTPGAAASRELMILAYPLRAERRAQVPAVVHVDGTCRVQTVEVEREPRYHALLARFFARTGVPLLLNTSFNDREPIVCSPSDAVATFLRTGIDALVLGDHLVERP